MTIYILDNDHKKIAEYLDDKSLDKMIKNIAQVLCDVHLFKSFFHSKEIKDKWSRWARECKANYLYLVELGFTLYSESVFRFGLKKINANRRDVIRWCYENVPDLPKRCFSCGDDSESHMCQKCWNDKRPNSFPLVMPKKYIVDGFDPNDFDKEGNGQSLTIQSYRNYYRANKLKQNIQKWTRRQKPDWLI